MNFFKFLRFLDKPRSLQPLPGKSWKFKNFLMQANTDKASPSWIGGLGVGEGKGKPPAHKEKREKGRMTFEARSH